MSATSTWQARTSLPLSLRTTWGASNESRARPRRTTRLPRPPTPTRSSSPSPSRSRPARTDMTAGAPTSRGASNVPSPRPRRTRTRQGVVSLSNVERSRSSMPSPSTSNRRQRAAPPLTPASWKSAGAKEQVGRSGTAPGPITPTSGPNKVQRRRSGNGSAAQSWTWRRSGRGAYSSTIGVMGPTLKPPAPSPRRVASTTPAGTPTTGARSVSTAMSWSPSRSRSPTQARHTLPAGTGSSATENSRGPRHSASTSRRRGGRPPSFRE